MPSFEVVVAITSRFHWELRPFLYLFWQFWSDQPITILSDKDPQMGDRYARADTASEWHGQFSNALRRFLERDCEADYIILLMADHWLVKAVDTGLLAEVLDYMQEHPDVIRCDLSPGLVDAELVYDGNIMLYQCPDHQKDCFLVGAIVPAIWSRQRLLDVLGPDWGIWETETQLSKRIIERGYKSLLALPALYEYRHIISTRQKVVNLRGFNHDIKAMIPGGFTVYE